MAYKIYRVVIDIQRPGRELESITGFYDQEAYRRIIKDADDRPGFRGILAQEIWVRTVDDLEKKEGR